MTSTLPYSLHDLDSQTVKAKRIIVVDDDCDDTEILKDIVYELAIHHNVHCINKAEEIYLYLDALTDEELPTLIIIDYNMPVISGKELINNLHNNKMFVSIPKIIYSATLRAWVIDECMQAGASACYKKGTTLEEIKAQVTQMLNFCK